MQSSFEAIKSILVYYTQSPVYIALLVGRIVVYGILVFAFYSLIDYLHHFSVVKNVMNNIVTQTTAQEKQRMENEYRIRRDSGAQAKISWISRLDLLILQSNIKKYIKWMNTQIFISIALAGGVLSMIITMNIKKSGSLGLFAMLLFMFGMYAILYALSSFNYSRVEKGLVSFANIADNFSKSSDDLITILDRVSWYVNEPMKTAIRECVNRAKNTGDTIGAMQQLQMQIEHPQFRQLIRNLEVASRHEANYSEIIEDNRKTLQEYMKFQQERAAIYANGRIELAGVAIAGLISLFMIEDMAECTIIEIMTTGIFGLVISIYFAFTFAYIIWVMFFCNTKDKQGGAY